MGTDVLHLALFVRNFFFSFFLSNITKSAASFCATNTCDYAVTTTTFLRAVDAVGLIVEHGG